MNNNIIIDDFFSDPSLIRNDALKQTFKKSSKNTGWKGYRSKCYDLDIINLIKEKLVKIDTQFNDIDLEVYYHYSLESTKNELKNNFEKNRLHKDLTEWAGVIYLTENPNKNSGTTLHDDNGDLIYTVDNIFNRFVFYRGNILHGVQDTFGDNINNSRMTITIFGNINKNKKINSLI
jgi:hypothetical protein